MASIEPYDESANRNRIAQLRERGVDVWGPERVYLSADVNLGNIEAGAIIRHATLTGSELQIGRGTCIGASGHALVTNCRVGRNVDLGAGSYEGAVILDEAKVRGYAEIRPGTLLEEHVEAAHSVAFKNTVLTATVVTGSLINYCDIFMSGGTSRSHHSEVGSGAIHFNFDPRGDKWSSLIGDVRGVLLRSAPVFVGGHCGLAGPVHVDFGAVLAAGSIIRRNVAGTRVHFESAPPGPVENFDPEIYTGLRRKFLTTAKIIGNLWALDAWYEQVRLAFAGDAQEHLYHMAREQIRVHIAERIRRLGKMIEKLDRSITKSTTSGYPKLKSFHGEHRLLIEKWRAIKNILTAQTESPTPPSQFLKEYEQARSSLPHVQAVQGLDDETARSAEQWLVSLALEPETRLQKLLDSR